MILDSVVFIILATLILQKVALLAYMLHVVYISPPDTYNFALLSFEVPINKLPSYVKRIFSKILDPLMFVLNTRSPHPLCVASP